MCFDAQRVGQNMDTKRSPAGVFPSDRSGNQPCVRARRGEIVRCASGGWGYGASRITNPMVVS